MTQPDRSLPLNRSTHPSASLARPDPATTRASATANTRANMRAGLRAGGCRWDRGKPGGGNWPMTDGDALYRAILDAPDDDAPRLVWADWLDEHGEADRAAFVRCQCEWTRLVPGHPRYGELLAAWQALEERHRDRWTAGLGEAGRFCGFWRGLPD